MSTCGEVGSDVHVIIKELAIRRIKHRSETYSNESQHLAEETEAARLRRRFSGSDVHVIIKELAIRRIEHRSETNSNESQHLVEEKTEAARLRRRFSFVLQQTPSFRTRRHLCRQGVALASTRQPRSQGPVSVHANRTEGVTESEGRKG